MSPALLDAKRSCLRSSQVPFISKSSALITFPIQTFFGSPASSSDLLLDEPHHLASFGPLFGVPQTFGAHML